MGVTLQKLALRISIAIFISLIVGGLAFLYHFRFSWNVLDIKNISWLLEGDKAGPLLGWLHFLHEDWQGLPLGKISNPLYAIGSSSLSLMDAIPLPSILLKAMGFAEGLSQYHGFWFLFCYIIQALTSYLILSLFTASIPKRLAGTAFLTFSPVLLYRADHISLCAHWVVLLCIYKILRTSTSTLKKILFWSALSFCALSIHPYFILFVITFAFFDSCRILWHRDRKKSVKEYVNALFPFVCIGLCSVLSMAVLGLLDSDARRQIDGGLHFYAADLLMFFNSGGKSRLTPELWQFRMGQYEAYSYLGLGILLLLLVYVIDHWGVHFRRVKNFLSSPKYGPCLAAVGLLAFFAMGSNIRIYGHWILDLRSIYEPFHPLLSSFRANGRFIWALFYLLIIVVVVHQPRAKWLQKFYYPVMLVLFALQLVDLSTMRPRLSNTRILTQNELVGDLPLEHFDTIDIVPPQTNDDQCVGYERSTFYVQFNILAAIYGLRVNSSYRAHLPSSQFQQLCQKSIEGLRNEHLRGNTIYVLQNQFALSMPKSFLKKYCRDLTTHYICALIS